MLFVLTFQVTPLPAETRGTSGSFPAASAVVSRTPMCRPQEQALIEPLHVDVVHWGGALYPGDDTPGKRKELTQRIEMVHGVGARYIGSINGRGFYHRGMDSEAVRLLDGQAFKHGGMNDAIYKCSLSPAMQRAFLLAARKSIDLGMDGLILDSWQGEGGTLCFCEHCLRFYRECLAEHREDPRLAECAEVDAETFDYAEYLRSRGFDATSSIQELPGGPAFREFRFARLLQQKRELLQVVRAHGSRQGRQGFTLTANVYSMPPMTFAIDDLLDYFAVELPYFGTFNGYPPRCTSISLLKKAHMVGKRCVVQPGCHDTARALIPKKSVSTLFKIWIAETYAAGHLFDFVPREFAGYENGEVVWLELPVVDLLPYYLFVQSHPEIYADPASLAKVAVLYSMAAAGVEPQAYEQEFQAVCKLLYDAHYQFDVLFAGDGVWNHRIPTTQELARYETIVVIQPQWLRPETSEVLLGQESAGGRLILCGKSRSERPGSGRLRERILGRRVQPGQMPSFSRNVTEQDEGTRDQFCQMLGRDPVLRTNAPATVGILSGRAGKRVILHLVNYDYREDGDTVNPVESVRIEIGVSAQRATLVTPDTPQRRILPLEDNGTSVSVTVPGLEIYSALVLE